MDAGKLVLTEMGRLIVAASGASPRRDHWCGLLQGLVLELARDGFRDIPPSVVTSLLTIIRHAEQDCRQEAEAD